MKKVFTSFLTAAFMVTNVGVSTLTSYAAEENTFTAHVNVYNEETNEPVSGIDVKFVEYDADLPTIPQPQANIVQVLSEWNTSDTNPYEIADIDFVKGHFYAVQIDNIPEGYCYSWEDHVITGIHGNGTLTGIVNYNIALQPHNPLPKVEYPLDIERNFTFSVVDKSTNQVIEGLDVELARMELDANVVNKYNYVETVDSWNTAADSYAITIPITYDVYDSPSAVFGIKINNMPEGYTYYQPPEDGYTVCGYYGAYDYRYDLYKGNDTTECIAYIYPEGEPHVYTSTKISDNTTTTTTTASVEEKEIYFQYLDSEKGYCACQVGEITGLYLANYDDGLYEIGETPINFKIEDETIAVISQVQGAAINVKGVAVGETVLSAETPDGQSVSVKIVVEAAPVITSTAVWTEETTTTTTTASVEEKEIYFQYLDSEKGYCACQVGEITGLYLANYDDGLYEIGETPINFKIEDETIAVISQVQGAAINVKGVAVGETVLSAETPDGQSVSVKIVVEEVTTTSSTAVWNEGITTTTTTTNSNSESSLPQTGYSNIYKVIAGLAALMTVSGAALVVKTRKENE